MPCSLPDFTVDTLFMDWIRSPEAQDFRDRASGVATGITLIHWDQLAGTLRAPLQAGPEEVLRALESVVSGADVARSFIELATKELASWWGYLGERGLAPRGLEVAEFIVSRRARRRLEVAAWSDAALAALEMLAPPEGREAWLEGLHLRAAGRPVLVEFECR